MKIGSLFSGIGGLDLACEQVFHGQTVWQVEREPYCQQVLAARFPAAQRFDDVTQVSADVLEPVDVLCGGFPCQDLSIAGKRAGLDGARSGLYSEMMRLVSELRPRFVVFENVPALMKYRERVHDDLAALGYGSVWQICQASDVGAPHRRFRGPPSSAISLRRDGASKHPLGCGQRHWLMEIAARCLRKVASRWVMLSAGQRHAPAIIRAARAALKPHKINATGQHSCQRLLEVVLTQPGLNF
jgi:DNA (cytosine-5)-methyltransferase 1